MKTPDLKLVIMDLKKTISQHPELVKRAGVFGSLATGKFTDKSDIDIAIEFAMDDNFDFERFAQFCEICERITEDLSIEYDRHIDVIQIEDNPRCLLHKIKNEVVWV